nr:hypothetical protein [Tanacetum cinerariifolium]
FWNIVLVKRSGDVTRLQALVEKKRIVIFEEVVREILQLNDAEGILLNSMEVLHSHYPTFLECQKNFMERVQFCHGFCIDLSLLRSKVLDKCSALILRVEGLKTANAAQQLEIIKLKARVKKLERLNKVKSSKLKRLKKVGTSQRIESSEYVENVFNQGRITYV